MEAENGRARYDEARLHKELSQLQVWVMGKELMLLNRLCSMSMVFYLCTLTSSMFCRRVIPQILCAFT
jgi:hypothetical protein